MGFTAEYAVDGKEAIDKILVGDGVVNHFDVVSIVTCCCFHVPSSLFAYNAILC